MPKLPAQRDTESLLSCPQMLAPVSQNVTFA
jgi:hypothetical protein